MPKWYFWGVTFLGLLIGFLAGASASPIVGVILPLLFALIGGASSFQAGSANLSIDWKRRQIASIGILLTVFSIAVLASAIYAALLRTGGSVNSLAAPLFRGPDTTDEIAGRAPLEAATLLKLRQQLAGLGATPTEISTLMSSLAVVKEGATKAAMPDKIAIEKLSKDAIAVYTLLQNKNGVLTDTSQLLADVVRSCLTNGTLLLQVSDQLSDLEMRDQASEAVKDLRDKIDSYLASQTDFSLLEVQPDLIERLVAILLQTRKLTRAFEQPEQPTLSSIVDAIDTLAASQKPVAPGGSDTGRMFFAYQEPPSSSFSIFGGGTSR